MHVLLSEISRPDLRLFIFLGAVLAAFLAVCAIRALISRKRGGNCDIDALIEKTGFAYDGDQGIFYSRMDSWQRGFGFCRLYDEAGAPLSMIMDCEPVRFDYGGKKWLIEMWKGQYAMSMGAEIGVYTADPWRITLPGNFDGYFYNAASAEDMLHMTLLLSKDGEKVFLREGLHWWLTGFVLGGFSEPEDLSVAARVVLKDGEMARVFADALSGLGYENDQYRADGNAVEISFTKPLSPQPVSRTKFTDYIIQRKNQLFCAAYRGSTRFFDLNPQKLADFFCRHRRMYGIVERRLTVGRQVEMHKKITQYIERNGG